MWKHRIFNFAKETIIRQNCMREKPVHYSLQTTIPCIQAISKSWALHFFLSPMPHILFYFHFELQPLILHRLSPDRAKAFLIWFVHIQSSTPLPIHSPECNFNYLQHFKHMVSPSPSTQITQYFPILQWKQKRKQKNLYVSNTNLLAFELFFISCHFLPCSWLLGHLGFILGTWAFIASSCLYWNSAAHLWPESG